MKWHEVKEQAAGEKRLLLLWYIYKFFGKNIVKFIVLFVTFFALLGAKKIQESSKKYLKIIGQKDSFYNIFRHCLSYSYALIDRMEIFSDNFSTTSLNDFIFVDGNITTLQYTFMDFAINKFTDLISFKNIS